MHKNGIIYTQNPPKFKIPKPTSPIRSQKLPWQEQKSADEDPEAPERMRKILNHPNYRLADEDSDFLKENAARGVRLQVDYLKAELLLQAHGVEHTIVAFGGTRIVEATHAKRSLNELKNALEKSPEDEELQKKYKIAEKVLEKSRFYEIGREFGKIVGRSGHGPGDCRLTVMTGGGPGIMEAVNRGAFDVGAKSIGLNITLPHEQFPNPYITPELCFQFHYFSMRKLHFFSRAKALVAFPGGFGTIDELIESLTLVQTRKINPFPIILVGKSFWEGVLNFDYLLDEGVIDSEDLRLFWYAETAQEIWEGIIEWHQENGTPLLL